jgi:cell division protein FtsL
MRTRQENGSWTPARFLGIILLLSSSLLLNAWWHIQAVRLSYQASHLSSMVSEAKSETEALHRELSRLSALARLEEWAKSQGRTRMPGAQQLILIHE